MIKKLALAVQTGGYWYLLISSMGEYPCVCLFAAFVVEFGFVVDDTGVLYILVYSETVSERYYRNLSI